MEFVFFDKELNKSVVLHGSVSVVHTNVSGGTPANRSSSSTGSPKTYNASGAMAFAVAVIVVYSMSVLLLVLMLSRRKTHGKGLDTEVGRFFKGLENARQQDKTDRVRRMRLRWPGNYIGLRFSSRPNVNYPHSNAGSEPASYGFYDSEYDSEDSYVEIPATTVDADSDADNDSNGSSIEEKLLVAAAAAVASDVHNGTIEAEPARQRDHDNVTRPKHKPARQEIIHHRRHHGHDGSHSKQQHVETRQSHLAETPDPDEPRNWSSSRCKVHFHSRQSSAPASHSHDPHADISSYDVKRHKTTDHVEPTAIHTYPRSHPAQHCVGHRLWTVPESSAEEDLPCLPVEYPDGYSPRSLLRRGSMQVS